MFNLIFTCLACAGLAFGANNIDKVQYESNDDFVFHQELKRGVSYNDESHVITLTADELNNYTWNNLNNVLYSDLEDTSYSLEEIIYPFKYNSVTFWLGNIYDRFGSLSFYLIKNDEKIEFYNNRFTYYNEDVIGSFEYDLQFTFQNYVEEGFDFYTSAKTAIQADILANQSPANDDYAGALGDFVSIMVAGLQNFGAGVANGVADFASALFLATDSGGNVTGLSIFGGIIAIFAGLALAVGITTRVYLWVTSLGK